MYRIERFIKHLSIKQWLETKELNQWTVEEARYVTPDHYEITVPRQNSDMSLRSTYGITYFLHTQEQIPASWSAHPVGLVFSAGGGEGLLKINGEFYHGLDKNHTFVPLRESYTGTDIQLDIELYDPIPEPHDPLNGQPEYVAPLSRYNASLVSINGGLRSLMYSVRVLLHSMRRLPENELRRIAIQKALEQVMNAAYNLPEESWQLEEPWQQLEQLLREQVQAFAPTAEDNGYMYMIGQSHIDIAWLWPVRETVRKSSRTFSTMCTLMEQYPEFIYSQSQPQLFAYVKDHYPELYTKVKERIAEGRWELVGGMWVEPDLNIPSGESLARQLLYGQHFYRDEFGITSTIEWLPDTFGYCASLPQLLRQAGIDYFMTTKLNWNDTNIFPYDLFHWVGIDGTPILSYLNHGVNESTTPKDIGEHWEYFRQKDVHPQQMLLYGHGDGGGGVTHEMIEYVEHADLMVGLPQAEFGTAKDFFAQTLESADDLPVWRGDLYLELHRGTYTTQAWNKRHNRKAELLYREAEIWERLTAIYFNQHSLTETSVVESSIEEASFQKSQLLSKQHADDGLSVHASLFEQSEDGMITKQQFKNGWLGIMLNQFHDIVPGSAIPEVYDTSEVEYAQILRIGESALNQALTPWTTMIAEQLAYSNQYHGTAYAVFNSLSWERGEWVQIEGGEELADVQVYDQAGQLLRSDLVTPSTLEPSSIPSTQSTHADVPKLLFTAAQPILPGHTTNTDSATTQETTKLSTENNDQLENKYTLRIYVPSIPAFDYQVIWLRAEDEMNTVSAYADIHSTVEVEDRIGKSVPAVWETPFYRIQFSEQGEISSLYDKEYEREVLKEHQYGNVFGFYHDRPLLWDAWDIDPHFAEQIADTAQLISSQVIMHGQTGDILHFRWQIGQSIISQKVFLYTDHRRIDFKTEVEWNESHKLLKVSFPVDLVAEQATYEIPFGALERTMNRNTSWDQAQYEVCGHRWADISEGNYGVSLLNDCKYGYDIKDCNMRLSLLRAPKWPDQGADIGHHEFTYSLLPHGDNWREAHIVRAAAELNQPASHRIIEFQTTAEQVQQPSQLQDNLSYSIFSYDSEHVILDTMKLAEDGQGTIIRLYESSGSRGKAHIQLPAQAEDTTDHVMTLVNILEDHLDTLTITDHLVELHFKPYEIKTLKWNKGDLSSC
ncbi:alpha-mannosidase [Paenibacillus sp. CFBP13512]|uniref:alpha-mannosidase n=1 Tax=Paenibacillus sp. CFBP13512 TaxID=2184007 RepID=UPI0010C152DB|nr:glycoside hydrolase family 38 C-terminal domain-containing protein [Paenibacillus sp. CFBP13512]TKJ93377.1 alpha-mannosidase [Paenibacillus sp. CFBP13512]